MKKLRAGTLALLLLVVGCGGGSGGEQIAQPALRAADLQARVGAALDACMAQPLGGSAEVQALVDAAGPDGVVVLGEGCYEIEAAVRVPDGTRLMGAGPDKTLLFRDPVARADLGGAMATIQNAAGGGARISGIGFVGVRNTEDAGHDVGVSIPNIQDFRVDNCYFEGFGSSGVSASGTSTGVVDHCVFVDIFKQGINNLGYGVVVIGTQDWLPDPGIGTEQAVFVEDCEFAGCRHSIASNGGAHYVFRHNLVYRNVVSSSVDAHGLGYGSIRGTQCVEIYANQVWDPVASWFGIGIRGGTGVIFGNSVRGFVFPIVLILEEGTPPELKETWPAADQVQDLWIWDNTKDEGAIEPDVHFNAVGFIEKDRDYFTEPRPQYVPYAYPHPLVLAD